jgi:hypothetical protein
LFEFNRNTDFNAYSWIPATDPVTHLKMKAPYHRNNFGGYVGGPIKHDKAFFFFSYAGLRQVQGGTVSGGVTPTAAERLGDFTQDSPAVQTVVANQMAPIYTPGTSHSVSTNQVNGVNAGPGCRPPL